MMEKKFRALGKVDLLQLLRDQELEIEKLAQQVERLEKQLGEKKLAQENAGSIAVAALQVNHIFRVAQESADIYLYNIRQMEERCKAENEALQARAQSKADEIVREAERKAAEREAREKLYVDALWVELQEKLLRYSKSYSELGELVKKIIIPQAIALTDISIVENHHE